MQRWGYYHTHQCSCVSAGQLPPSPFDPPVAPWDPSLPPYSYGPQQHAPDPGAPGAAQVEVQSAADVPRRKPRARRGTRAPTGYNLFVKEITDQQHADGRYSLYPDSQVDIWGHLHTSNAAMILCSQTIGRMVHIVSGSIVARHGHGNNEYRIPACELECYLSLADAHLWHYRSQ